MDLSQLKLTSGVNLTLVEVQSGATNIQHVENYFPNVTSVELPQNATAETPNPSPYDNEETDDTDQEDIPEWLLEDINTTFINVSNNIVPSTIKKAAATCSKPEHYACLMQVCYDHNCLIDIMNYNGFAKAMLGWGCKKRRLNTKGARKGELQTWEEAVKSLANSMLNTGNKIKPNYKSWPETGDLKDLKRKCLLLGSLFEENLIPYRPKG